MLDNLDLANALYIGKYITFEFYTQLYGNISSDSSILFQQENRDALHVMVKFTQTVVKVH